MQLPTSSSSYRTRVRFSLYVARRLRRAKHQTLADDAAKVTASLKEAGRAWDDADDEIQGALADRDAADDELDLIAQETRHALAGRSLSAVNESPYTDIFSNGVTYYTAAPLDEEVKRYSELKQRLTEHLPASDGIRKKAGKALDSALKELTAATGAVDAARTAESLAATRLTKATDAWSKQMEKTYGALVADIGRAAAERFFPKRQRKTSKEPQSGPDKGSQEPA